MAVHAHSFGLDTYVVDSLMPDLVGHDRRASALVVFLFLWRRTRGASKAAVLSLAMIADGTGLAKRSVQTALAVLKRRRLVTAKKKTSTSAPAYVLHCEWR